MGNHTHCRICGRALPAPFLDLGEMPLANSFLSTPAEASGEPRYPLAVASCHGCGLAQLTYVVPAEQLYRDYIYVSSTSDGVRRHGEHLADTLIAQFCIDARVPLIAHDPDFRSFVFAGLELLE